MISSIIELIFWLMLLTLALAALSLAPWVPTRRKDLERILKLADLKPGDKFYDLGCGDGRVAFYISENSPAKAFGIELAVPFYLYCLYKNSRIKIQKPFFKLKSIYQEDLSHAQVVYLFAANSKKFSEKLVKKLNSELPNGAKIISYAFPILDLKAKLIDKPSETDIAIYLYEITK